MSRGARRRGCWWGRLPVALGGMRTCAVGMSGARVRVILRYVVLSLLACLLCRPAATALKSRLLARRSEIVPAATTEHRSICLFLFFQKGKAILNGSPIRTSGPRSSLEIAPDTLTAHWPLLVMRCRLHDSNLRNKEIAVG